MNVSVQDIGPCKKLMRVELEADRVEKEFDSITKQFVRHGKLQGFRPGKAPLSLIRRTFGSRIEEEVKKKLIGDAYREALKEKGYRPVRLPDIEDSEPVRGQPMAFTATVEVEPDFDTPDYKGLPLRRDERQVSDEDVSKALDVLRDQRAKFADVSRPVQPNDYVVVNYTGTCEGKPITDLAPANRGLAEKKDFWLHVKTESFIPGFTDQLIGAGAGDKRTVTVTYPQDFVARELSSKQGVYEVEVLQVKEKPLPALDDEFATSFGAENLDKLRVGVRADLETELRYKRKRQIRDQLVAGLLGRVNFELPESLVQSETRNVVHDLVRANQERGIAKEAIDQRKDQIYTVANNSAKERVKVSLILNRIAEAEGIEATNDEVSKRVYRLAVQSQTKPEKLAKELTERGAIPEIQREIMAGKVLDLLELHATIAGESTPK